MSLKLTIIYYVNIIINLIKLFFLPILISYFSGKYISNFVKTNQKIVKYYTYFFVMSYFFTYYLLKFRRFFIGVIYYILFCLITSIFIVRYIQPIAKSKASVFLLWFLYLSTTITIFATIYTLYYLTVLSKRRGVQGNKGFQGEIGNKGKSESLDQKTNIFNTALKRCEDILKKKKKELSEINSNNFNYSEDEYDLNTNYLLNKYFIDKLRNTINSDYFVRQLEKNNSSRNSLLIYEPFYKEIEEWTNTICSYRGGYKWLEDPFLRPYHWKYNKKDRILKENDENVIGAFLNYYPKDLLNSIKSKYGALYHDKIINTIKVYNYNNIIKYIDENSRVNWTDKLSNKNNFDNFCKEKLPETYKIHNNNSNISDENVLINFYNRFKKQRKNDENKNVENPFKIFKENKNNKFSFWNLVKEHSEERYNSCILEEKLKEDKKMLNKQRNNNYKLQQAIYLKNTFNIDTNTGSLYDEVLNELKNIRFTESLNDINSHFSNAKSRGNKLKFNKENIIFLVFIRNYVLENVGEINKIKSPILREFFELHEDNYNKIINKQIDTANLSHLIFLYDNLNILINYLVMKKIEYLTISYELHPLFKNVNNKKLNYKDYVLKSVEFMINYSNIIDFVKVKINQLESVDSDLISDEKKMIRILFIEYLKGKDFVVNNYIDIVNLYNKYLNEKSIKQEELENLELKKLLDDFNKATDAEIRSIDIQNKETYIENCNLFKNAFTFTCNALML